MNDSEKTPFDLEQVELKTDVHIHRGEDPPNPKQSSSKAWPVVLMLGFMAIGGCGVAVFYFTRFKEVREDYMQLQKEIDTASQNLTTTSGSLEETRQALSKSQTSVQRMREELDQRKSEIETLEKAAKQLKSDSAQQKKRLESAQGSIKELNTKLEKSEATANELTKERDRLKQAMADQEERDATRIEDLNKALEASQAQATEQARTYRTDLKNLQSEKSALESEIERLRQQAETESQAGMEIIRERGQLKSENERLKLNIANLEKSLNQTRQQLNRVQNVQTGDLVSYSEEITPAQATFQEPLPEGVKLPRGLDQVVVMTLVDENGGVDKAFLLPGQSVDGILARDIISTVYKWKFRPARKGNTRVKVWQPILFR